jgi:hypothetical protein
VAAVAGHQNFSDADSSIFEDHFMHHFFVTLQTPRRGLGALHQHLKIWIVPVLLEE